MLPQEAIEEFKTLYREQFCGELSDEDVQVRAEALINLYRAVCIKYVGK